MSTDLRNVLTLVFLALIWGSSFILMNLVLKDSDKNMLYSPMALGAMRLVLAGLVLAPVAIKHIRKLKGELFWPVLIVGVFGNGIPAFLFAVSLNHIDSGLAGILNSLVPLSTVLLGVVLFQLKINKFTLLGVFVGLLGAIGLVVMKKGVSVDAGYLGYAGLVILATLCYALSVNTIQHKLKGTDAIVIASLGLFLAALPSSLILAFTDFKEVLTSNPEGIKGLGFCFILSAVGTAFALVLFNKLVQKSSAVFASMVTYLIPIVAVMWGIYYGEQYSLPQLAFGLVILLGVYIVKWSKRLKV
ncbi:MAG: DMT family transporter [Flavobacteriales bacterium]